MTQLHKAAKNYLKKVNNIPSLATMTALEAREMRAKLHPPKIKIARLASIDDKAIRVRDGSNIPIRIYTPEGNGPFPIVIYYHGGGWVLNDLNTCHESCSYLAKETNSIIVSVEYRLAPEYKFPVPLYDAYDAFLWVRANVENLGGEKDLISVAGDSAGGNLATAVTLLAKKEQQKIAAQILLYPVTELSYNSVSYSTYANGYGLDKDVMKWFGNYYIRQEGDIFNPLLAPLLADVRELPPAFVLVAENDVLRD
ncbi:alpha/beta hydrolase [Lysinibacillus sp. 54212]|uniref:alpha/beta hydrolase n=1 Tax=Lysinibacillus sp. 54212 TaxID=3119829 RepID=UPI002FC58834